MNCATCKVNKIGPNTAPYGGYMCGNEHLQCRDCNVRADGQCMLCEDSTNFVQMNYNTPSETLTSPVPTAPPLDGDSNLGALSDNNTSNIFPRDFFATIETQSNLSQEHLSMHESHVSGSEPAETHEHEGQQQRVPSQSQSQSQAQDEAQAEAEEQSKAGARSQQLLQTASQQQQLQQRALDNDKHAVSQRMSKKLLDVTSAQVILNRQDRAQLDTFYLGASSQQTSASNFTFQLRLENGLVHLEPSKMEANETMQAVVKLSKHARAGLAANIDEGKLKATKDMLEDLEDPNVIHTSEIRFMESTESLKNYYSGGTMHPALKSRQEQSQNTSQQESLSMKVLHDFESQNTAHPAELVENYLRSYGPLALCHFPAYSFNQNCYQSNCDNWTAQQRQAHMRSICVSTESEPSLAGNYAPIKIELPAKYFPPEFFVMQATGVAEPVPGTLPNPDKIALPSIDIRMQKVLETFQEDPHQPKVIEKPLLDQQKNFVKLPVPELQTLQESQPLDLVAVEPAADIPAPEKASNDMAARLSNSHRAYYNPPTARISILRHGALSLTPEPQPQFQLITCSALVANELALAKGRYLDIKPLAACLLNIPRAPIQCPESSCHRMIFVSDFNKHMIVDHSKLPMERIATRQCKNFFLDPRLAHNGVSKCHLLYLIRDKITDLGSGKFKDFLPLLVMSTRIKLSELCDVPEEDRAALGKSDLEFLMIWLTGIVPEEFPVSVSLTVWPRSGQVPSCHMVHSGEMYSIRKSQRVADVLRSGQMLLLTEVEVEHLTNGGKEMLELQLVVH